MSFSQAPSNVVYMTKSCQASGTIDNEAGTGPPPLVGGEEEDGAGHARERPAE